MKLKFLIILLSLFYIQSHSQEFDEIKYDSKLQAEYKDTLQSISEKITGKWKYLGRKNNGTLIDTLFARFWDKKKTYGILENGITYEIVNGKRGKADYYYETTFDFEKRKGRYSREKIYSNEIFNTYSLCQPVLEIIYYGEKFGILFKAQDGEYFEAINELNTEKLILENGKEYLKIE